jgi:hypothetical protein
MRYQKIELRGQEIELRDSEDVEQRHQMREGSEGKVQRSDDRGEGSGDKAKGLEGKELRDQKIRAEVKKTELMNQKIDFRSLKAE